MKKIIIFLILLITIALIIYRPQTMALKYVSVQMTEQGQTLIENGNVAPAIKKDVVSGSSGNLLSITENNTYVKKGELIASIDNKRMLDEIRGFENEVANLQRALNLQKITTELNLKSYDASVRTYRNKLKRSEEIYNYEKAKPHPHEVKTMQVDLELSKLKRAEAERVLKIETKLYEKGFISIMAYDKYIKNLKLAKENLRQVITQNTSLMKGVDPDKLKVLDQNIQNSQVALEKQIELRKRKEASLKNQIDETKAKINSLNTDLKYKKKIAVQTQIKSPSEGYLKIKKRRDFSAGGIFLAYQAGNSIGQNVIIANIVDPSKMEVNCTVNESDYDKIREGMAVDIEFIAYPKKNIKGRVTSISGLGQDRNTWIKSSDGDSRVYLFDVKIELNKNNLKLHPGMSAAVTFKLADKRAYLTIPRSAIIHTETGLFVQTRNGRKNIEGRVLDHFNFSIENGISEGDEVLLYPGGNHE
ncbi:HlyD family efflux transporter periplasmic adaptor subunit [Lentisphaera profundi]|uniref:HlyD family efflux transporter periplasmic adaptor subunit n=1 Tax=Lentisphaera profundi TaxID=1658616 RepID=A0ABY7VR29_9BACT|nr:HlyD family efflux transporter periplasmic adaptor subunit [Lentisphaera profundi]WDE96169.1 HlyD family efflux transporter periplasmic adaptor subunit [Lentisphaera profundi]